MKKYCFILFIALIASCTSEPTVDHDADSIKNIPPPPRVKGPVFNGDSAYAFVKTQVDFGPRIPDTQAHTLCYEYFERQLKSYGLTVTRQTTAATMALDNRMISIQNIFAQYHPERKERILLLAHWDTRAFADDDPDPTKRKNTFDGADDGASGAAVLLEIARILQEKDPNIGVDFLFSDAEDGGINSGAPETWCLGTQYWTQNMPKDYSARFGILMDMVGGKRAIFPREGTGDLYARWVVDKVWNAAARLGYGNIFIDQPIGQTVDDHKFVNQNARIPTIDIVHYDMQRFTYPEWHHTTADNMEIIDASTLKVVGEVVVEVIYNEIPK